MPASKRNLVRILTIFLGCLWLIDAILQLQPAMFTGAFAINVLQPSLAGQPGWAAALVSFGISVASINPFWFNAAIIFIQFLIAALLLLPARDHLQRSGLWLSIFWALTIWIFGEGFGGIFTGSATFYTGAPGSALLYAILALFLLDEMDERRGGKKTERSGEYSKYPLEKLPATAGIIFLLGAALNLAPMFWQPTMLSMLASMPAASNWLGAFGAQGTMVGNFIAADALAALGIFLLLMPRNRAVTWTALAFLAAVWVIGQNFGGILAFPFSTATDPNSAVVMMGFLVPVF